MTTDDYTTGFTHGAQYVIGIIRRAAAKHPRTSAKQTLTSLHDVLEEGLKQWLKETENSTSRSSSTPQ